MNRLNISFNISVGVPGDFKYKFSFDGLRKCYSYKGRERIEVTIGRWSRLGEKNRFFGRIFS